MIKLISRVFPVLTLITGILINTPVLSQQIPGTLTVDPLLPPQQMVQNLVGPGVQISNVQVTAASGSYGYFNITGTEIGTSEGIILSTGKAVNAIGPNDESGLPLLGPPPTFTCLNCANYNNNAPGSALLNAAQDRTTFDASQIEFDIIPQGDSLRFRYTFASEEYNEWVGSPFNDVFGFFISGPNIGTNVNIALVPQTSTVVAINTVNAVSNSQYWVNNITPPGQGFQFDGFTIDLVAAVGNLIPCESYHLTLVIADGSDRIYDSAVLINQIESNPIQIETSTAGGTEYMIEGCNSGFVTFSRPAALPTPQNITYFIGGSALNGVDYTQIGNGIPNEPITVVIPANQASVSVPIDAFADGVTEGSEFISIFLQNPSCTAPDFLDSVNFEIRDFLEVSITPPSAGICNGQCVDLIGDAVVTNVSSFTWSPTNNLSNSTTLTPTACPTTSTTYTLTSNVSECVATASVSISVSSITLGLDTDPINCPNGNNGSIDLTVLNANPPYSYSWTGPNGFTSNVEDPIGVEEGEYCVEVEDANGCVASGCVTVFEFNVLTITDVDIIPNGCFPISCFGACDGTVNTVVTGGQAPYTFAWLDESNTSVASTQNVNSLCAGVYTFVVTDANGCEVNTIVVIEQPDELVINLVGTSDVLCDGTSTGSITVDASGGCSPYFYNWSGFPANQTPVLNNIPTGNYQVSVSDVNGCSSGNSLNIVVNPPIDPLEVTIDAISSYPGGFNTSCPGSTDGSIQVTASFGTAPYTFEWINIETNAVVGTSEDLENVPCGEYQLTVTDGNGCEEVVTATLTCVPQIQITFDTEPNPCGDENAGVGEINILTTNGGHGGPYTYIYTGPSCAPCAAEDLTGLNSGAYNLTVFDALGCSRQFTINVGTDSEFQVNANVTDPTCGLDCNGSINVTVTPADIYTFVWTNGNGDIIGSNEDISNLCAGDYQLQVSANGCDGFYAYTLTAPEPLDIDIANVINPICFGQNNGSIDIEVSGGVGPYTYAWSSNNGCVFFGSSDEDITNLFDCCYTVVVTDATGCQVTQEICLEAPQVMDLFVSTPSDATGLFDISCFGASDGSISASASGGTPDCNAYPNCYLFEWSVDVTQFGNPDPNAAFITGLPAGTYALNVTDINGCLATTTINLTEPSQCVSNFVIQDVSCNGASDGTIAPNISGGSGTFVNFLWEPSVAPNAADAEILTGLDAGCYTLTVTDSQDCTNTFTYCIEEPEELTANLDVASPTPCVALCDGFISVNVSGGTEPYTITAVDGDGNSYSGNFLQDLCDGEYTVTVVDANGCIFTTETSLDSPEPFTVEIFPDILNPGQPFTLNCTGDCDGALTSLITGGTGPFTYEWSNTQGDVLGNTENISDLCAGTYCVVVTDANGCEVEECFTITEPNEPLLVSSTPTVYAGGYNISCFGACDGAIDITVTGGVPGYTYLWNDGNILSPEEDQSNLCAGYIEVLVTDENGCEVLVPFDLTEPAPIVVNASISTFTGNVNVSCSDACDGSITLEILGGEAPFTVNWPDLGISDDASIDGLCPGVYNAIVTDAIGCTSEVSYTLNAPAPLAIQFTSTFDCATGVTNICALPSGGTAPYSYSWNNSTSTNCTDVSANGEYCVTITDANGCEFTACFTVNAPSPITATAIITESTCGQCNGAIQTTVIGGDGSYLLDWNGTGTSDNELNQSNLCAGTYDLTIDDQNGCAINVEFVVPGQPAPFAQSVVNDVSCNGSQDGSVAVNFVNTVGNVSTTWNINGNIVSGGNTVTGLGFSAVTLTWSDENGCSGTEQFFVLQPDSLEIEGLLSLSTEGFNISVLGGNDGAIDLTVNGGTEPYDYNWSHITIIPEPEDVANLTAGNYAIIVIDANGCSDTASFTLTEPGELQWPTGITPNGDGFNDVYFIKGIEKYRSNEFKVFNRWGNLVYEKKNYNQNWFGQNSDNETLPDGTYFVIFTSGNVSFNTYVDLRR